MANLLRPTLVLLALFSLATGLVYPLAVTGLARSLFPNQAEGSLILVAGEVRGSELIGQEFTGPGWFWSRPSATTRPYDGAASAGANLGPSHPTLHDRVRRDVARLAEPGLGPVPIDLVTTSASGLDPHVSPAAALFQVPRVARARGTSEDALRRLVAAHVEGRQWGVFGEPRVNVLRLNLALEAVTPLPAATP
ncbi:MAG: potassium-transporting ATPase subunit KdpC [Thermoanaerobaculia bacterium]|nr:potassium-transporting ATPase subunit KdpC [Thermoanaerobaculia bacterium]